MTVSIFHKVQKMLAPPTKLYPPKPVIIFSPFMSPESATTVVYLFNWSRDDIATFFCAGSDIMRNIYVIAVYLWTAEFSTSVPRRFIGGEIKLDTV